jgi:hypothetical protein
VWHSTVIGLAPFTVIVGAVLSGVTVTVRVAVVVKLLAVAV